MRITPTPKNFGAVIEEFNLSDPISALDIATLLTALGRFSVLRFPDQHLTPAQLKAFSSHFGTLQPSPTGRDCEPGMPEVTILSNIIEDGKPIGVADAGQDWHTDMTYNPVVGFSNVLYGIEIPHRDGRPLGATHFADMRRAYDDLPDPIKQELNGAWAVHDFSKFWDEMRSRPGSRRGPMTEQMKASLPPSRHPVFLQHPINGNTILYCNPGYAVRIEGMNAERSDSMLAYLFKHQLNPTYQYTHHWTVGDVLMWDHIGTLHMAQPDYLPSERRLVKRCQIMADRIFDPEFVRQALAPLRSAS